MYISINIFRTLRIHIARLSSKISCQLFCLFFLSYSTNSRFNWMLQYENIFNEKCFKSEMLTAVCHFSFYYSVLLDVIQHQATSITIMWLSIYSYESFIYFYICCLIFDNHILRLFLLAYLRKIYVHTYEGKLRYKATQGEGQNDWNCEF